MDGKKIRQLVSVEGGAPSSEPPAFIKKLQNNQPETVRVITDWRSGYAKPMSAKDALAIYRGKKRGVRALLVLTDGASGPGGFRTIAIFRVKSGYRDTLKEKPYANVGRKKEFGKDRQMALRRWILAGRLERNFDFHWRKVVYSEWAKMFGITWK